MTTFIPQGYGFNVGQDFARATEDTLINEPRFERGHVYGYIAGNPQSKRAACVPVAFIFV